MHLLPSLTLVVALQLYFPLTGAVDVLSLLHHGLVVEIDNQSEDEHKCALDEVHPAKGGIVASDCFVVC